MDAQVDALYFQARETGVAYAIVEEAVVHPSFKSHFGVRGRIGTYLGEDCWKIWLQYLHYHSRVRDQIEGNISPSWGFHYQVLTDSFLYAHSMWRLHMGLADLNWGRQWEVSPWFTVLPYTGLRYSEIRHKLKIAYGDQSELSMKNKFFGFGPQLGCLTTFRCWNGVSLFARLSANLLYTRIYLHQDQKGLRGTINDLEGYWQVRPQFEASLGLVLQWCQFFGQVAGELFFFPQQNQLDQQGDLSLHGISFGGGLEF